MPTHLKFLAVAGLATSLFALPAAAQYAGPSSASQQKQVAEILKSPVDDEDVTIQGHLLRKLGDEKYMFSDGSGEIVAEIDDDDFPREPVDEASKVELVGEVDTSRRRPPELDVDNVRIVK